MAALYFSKRVGRSAAQLAYFLALSVFPAVICVNAIIGALNLDMDQFADEAALLIPAAAFTILTDYVEYVTANRSPALLAVGLTTMIWFGSAALRSLMEVIDDIYGRRAYKGAWSWVASVVFAALLLLTIYLSLVVVLTGNWFFHLLDGLIHRIPRLSDISLPWAWQWLRFLVLFAMVLAFVTLLYRATAPREKPRPPVLAGALFSSVTLVLFSILFSYFIGLSSRYSLVYGSLASVVILLVWLYFCGTIVILGACFNQARYGRKSRSDTLS